ncbi:baculoviral IAP repeat-containing protein 1 isoform X2 [Grus americana]|uniref:baculoviral IAP repeat-containing protein 1 isoform X2 n=1 Tax=Grus americana TaxID=9117 RepID=UPI002407B64D|nr:baculoviral IAP repeat-containing protein 1 isoform X2 [Grus americana]
MSAKEDPTVETSDNEIHELNPSAMQALFPHAAFDFHKFAKDMEAEFQEFREQLQNSYNPTMRNEHNRLKSFLSYTSHSSWSLTEMAAAGFYHTLVKSSVQCFCCGLVLFTTKVRCTPYEQHKKFRPTCEFVLGKEVGNISKYDIRVQKLEKSAEHAYRYSGEDARLQSFDRWPFYARGTKPNLLARAGFFFTGKKDTVQCFTCGGCLGNWEDGDDPWREHAKWFPECEFLQSKKSSEEIKKYIETYGGFVGVVGRHFTASFMKENLSTATGDLILNIFEDEGVRLDSFKTWPAEAHVEATALAKAGFFYTGEGDKVQCFNCAGCLKEWEKGEDPMKEHAKWFPDSNCLEVLGKSLEEQPESPSTLPSVQQTQCKAHLEEKATLCSVGADMTVVENQCPQEAKNLTKQLTKAYNDNSFSKLFSFGNSNHLAIDLKLLYGDLSVVSKDINDQPIQQLFLHEILVNLNSTIVLEGEAGSGKTALLRKIALLWASGCCPILSRFKFVFYLSLTYARSDQSMADIICNQPVGFMGPLTETTLRDVIQPLKNQVLFLLDDYSEMNSVPQAVEELIQKNHLYQHCLVVAVRTNRMREIRKYAATTLSIREFPLSSTLYILKKLFSCNIDLVEQLLFQLQFKKSMQTIITTPLFMVSLAAYWVQHPKGDIISDKAIFKAYLLYHLLKHSEETEHVLAMFSSCGELALTGLFKPSFEFTEYDLSEAGVDGDEAVRLGLLSKFTAQRLHPVYKFFHPLFQEFLAGRRLSELLVSDEKEKLEQGLQYLQQINTFRKVAGRYNFLLVYACSFSSKAVPQIISYLFKLIDCKHSLESQSENDEHLQHHSDLPIRMCLIDQLSFIDPKLLLPVFIQYLLDFATSVVYSTNTVSVCAPIILQFLRGKDILLSSFLLSQKPNLRFFQDYPESLSLPSSFQVAVQGSEHKQAFNISEIITCYSSLELPTIDRDYAPAFTLFKDMAQKIKEKNINRFFSLIQRHLPDSITCPFLLTTRKMPLLKCTFTNISSFQEADLRNLMALFSISDYIELRLSNSPGFIEVIRPAIEQYKEHFKKCSLHHLNLSTTEQELLLSMSFVECLEVDEKEIPELLFSNLDKFICLEELSVSQCENCNVFDRIPDGFKNLCNMKKLLMSRMKLENCSRLVEFIKSFQDLSVFHLDCSSYFDSESLLTAISSCKKLTEIKLTGSFLRDQDLLSLAAALPNFVSLKVLGLGSQYFDDKEACEIFAHSLGGVLNLEELILPAGKGIKSAAKLIVQQCLHLLHLRCFSFILCLDDDGLLEIAKVANRGGFQKLENLYLSVNHDVTETGWRNFFRTLNNMPALKELNISRMFTHQIKASASTVTAFVQCVSRLPGLVTIVMFGWLLDAEDLKMFDIMKEQHPQSRSLKLSWQWVLPLSPNFQD